MFDSDTLPSNGYFAVMGGSLMNFSIFWIFTEESRVCDHFLHLPGSVIFSKSCLVQDVYL